MDLNSYHEHFIRIYDEHADTLYRHAVYRVSRHEDALDLVQDTFTKTWEYINQGNEISNLKSFLYSVLNNKIIDFYRKKKSHSLDDLSEKGFNPSESDSVEKMSVSAEIKQIVKMLDRLPENYRDVVVMRYIDDLPPKEIAKITGEKENTVSVRLNRAVEKMKKILEIS